MKKIFTLCAVAMAVLSASAQKWNCNSLKVAVQGEEKTTYKVQESAITKSDSKLTTAIVSNKDASTKYTAESDPKTVVSTGDKLQDYTITQTEGDVTMTIVATPNQNILFDGGDVYTYGLGVAADAASGTNNKSLDTDNCIHKYNDYIKIASGNPSNNYIGWYYDDAGTPKLKTYEEPYWSLSEAKVPQKGAYQTFKTAKDGNLEIALFVNKSIQNNVIYVLDVNADGSYTALAPADLHYKGYINNNTAAANSWFEGNAADNYCVTTNTSLSNPFFGYLTFAAKAGHTYMLLTPKSQIGIYGFCFPAEAPEASGISAVAADNAAAAPRKVIENGRIMIGNYNIAGQRVK